MSCRLSVVNDTESDGWLGSSVTSPQNCRHRGLTARSSLFDPSHPTYQLICYRLPVVFALVAVSSLGSRAWAQPSTEIEAALALEAAVTNAVAKAERSVVAVARAPKSPDAPDRLVDPDFVPSEYGTGVVVDRRGLILTCAHVLGDTAKNDYAVWLGRRPFRATVKASDPYTDLAILEVDADDLTPIAFGDATALKKGRVVLSLGNPFAIARDGDVCASWGIVSNLSRKAAQTPRDERVPGGRSTIHHYGTLIQTDAKLHRGTSGGVLANLQGEMVGLTTALAVRPGFESAAGYAIPVDPTFRRIIETLKQGREVEHGFLGAAPAVGTRGLSYHERKNGKSGVLVSRIVVGTPAAASSLKMDDLITHIDDKPIHDPDHLMLTVMRRLPGETARIRFERGTGDRHRVLQTSVTLSKKEKSTDPRPIVTTPPRYWRGMRVDYVTAMPGFRLGNFAGEIDPAGCVAVVDVRPNTPAFQAGVQAGAFISHAAAARVATPAEFFKAVDGDRGAVAVRIPTGGGKYTTKSIRP